MARFGLNGGTYQAQSIVADAELSMNCYPELAEADGEKSRIQLYITPGLLAFVTLPESPLRGECTVNGRMFAVCGTKFEAHSGQDSVTL